MPDYIITHIGDTELSQPLPFIHIEAKDKTFMFQADEDSNEGSKNEGIPITFEKDFWLCAYQTTQECWAAVIQTSKSQDLEPYPSHHKGKTRPVEQVSWDDIQVFNRLFTKLIEENLVTFENTKIKGSFELPSETQWEYAANAGQDLVFAGSQNLNDVGWFTENCNNQTMPVGLKTPNAFKLYDMTGNVWEWCADDYTSNMKEILKNGQPFLKKEKEQHKALRGGSRFNFAGFCRLRYRFSDRPDLRNGLIGFRLCFSPSSTAHES